MDSKSKELRIVISQTIDHVQNGLIHPQVAREELAEKIEEIFGVKKQSEIPKPNFPEEPENNFLPR